MGLKTINTYLWGGQVGIFVNSLKEIVCISIILFRPTWFIHGHTRRLHLKGRQLGKTTKKDFSAVILQKAHLPFRIWKGFYVYWYYFNSALQTIVTKKIVVLLYFVGFLGLCLLWITFQTLIYFIASIYERNNKIKRVWHNMIKRFIIYLRWQSYKR